MPVSNFRFWEPRREQKTPVTGVTSKVTLPPIGNYNAWLTDLINGRIGSKLIKYNGIRVKPVDHFHGILIDTR